MRRGLKIFSLTAGGAAALFVILSLIAPYHYQTRAALVSVREFIFSVPAKSLEAWNASPAELQEQYGFVTDNGLDVTRLSGMTASALAGAPSLPPDTPFPENALKALFPQSKDECGTYKGLQDSLHRLTRSGASGCCSDYVQAFIALAASQGVFAREVRIKGHTFAEYYSPQSKSWIWVDPTFALSAKENLSFIDLRSAILKGEKVLVTDHRTGKSFSLQEAQGDVAKFYAAENFGMSAMLLGNNVYAEYAFDKAASGLPVPLRQLLAYAFGIKPRTLVFRQD